MSPTFKRAEKMKRLITLICCALLSACASSIPPKENYLPQTERSGPAQQLRFQGSLKILPWTAQAPFGERQFFYRESAQRFAKDPYREWLASPAELITARSQSWLTSSGLFGQVLPLSSKQTADYQLNGEIIALYTDLQAQPYSLAKLHIRLSSANSPVILDTILTANVAINGTNANDIAEGLDRALASAFKQLESKLILLPSRQALS